MDAGEAQVALQAIREAMPGAEETPVALAGFDPNALLPEGRGYFAVRRLPHHATLLRGGRTGL